MAGIREESGGPGPATAAAAAATATSGGGGTPVEWALNPISGRDGFVASCDSAAERPSLVEVAAAAVVVVVVELETKPIVGGRL